MDFFEVVMEKVRNKMRVVVGKDVEEVLDSHEQLQGIRDVLEENIPNLVAPVIAKEALPQLKETIVHAFKVGLLVGSEMFIVGLVEAAEEIKE